MGFLAFLGHSFSSLHLPPPPPTPSAPLVPLPSEPAASAEASLCKEAVAGPPYLCPRSGRLLVPRPQSPFDPLLGSGHVTRWAGRARAGGRRSPTQLLGRPRSFVPSSLARLAGALRWSGRPGSPPPHAPGLSGNGASRSPSMPGHPAPHSRRDSPLAPGRGGGNSVLHAGLKFSAAEQKSTALCVTAEAL